MRTLAKVIVFCFAVFSAGGVAVQSQQPPVLWGKGERPNIAISEPVSITNYSQALRRYVSYRVILPANYAHKNVRDRRYPVIYLLHGLWGSHKNWTELTKLSEHAAGRDVIIITPEGGDGWYVDSPVAANNNWETYFIKELIPEVDVRFRTNAARSNRIVAGLSMGGYGSIKFGLKYPELFGMVGSFSGCVDCANWTETNGGRIGKTVEAVMGPAGTDFRRANDIEHMVKNLSPEQVKELPFVYMSCGETDQFIEDNRKLDALLTEKNVPHTYRKVPGSHNWAFWNDAVREFLVFTTDWLKK